MMDTYIILLAVILLAPIFPLVVLHNKKRAVIQRINALTPSDKKETLDQLLEPVGYVYEPYQDIFSCRLDAPQRLFGYSSFYDLSAPYLNMILDYETFYFDYNNRTWLLEIWKGQYGINAGCELGIYYADTLVSPEKYSTTLFHAVDNQDMMDISLKLNKLPTKSDNSYQKLAALKRKHWWLTIFKLGKYSNPRDLFVNISARFKDSKMMYSFLESFILTLPTARYKISGLTMYFNFAQSNRAYTRWQKTIRRTALISCATYCKWFNYLTRPYSGSGDKVLYVYYYLPVVFTHMFKNVPGK